MLNKQTSCTIKKIKQNLTKQKIIILGLGREGYSTYSFIRQLLPNKKLLLVDEKEVNKLEEKWQSILKKDSLVTFSHSFNPKNTLIFKTPGISSLTRLGKLAKKGTVTSNTNLLVKLAKTKKNIKIIGVTGTKGKSTTTTLIYHVLQKNNKKVVLGGNIGTPPLDLWAEIKNNTVVVLELSSHQLETANFSPNIVVLLSITPEHLDYYHSFSKYIEAKSNITKKQTTQDLVIYDATTKLPQKIASLGKAKQIPFKLKTNFKNNWLIYNDEQVINLKDLPLLGKHNIINTLPTIIIAKEFGLSTTEIVKGISTFHSLPHRLEVINKAKGITYINDSLSTTPESAVMAINSFPNKPIILLTGGYDRGLKLNKLAKKIATSNIKYLVLFPSTGKKLLQELKKITSNPPPHIFVDDMKKAVKIAKKQATKGDIVLLSPASASFNLFTDYRDRGNQFEQFVLNTN